MKGRRGERKCQGCTDGKGGEGWQVWDAGGGRASGDRMGWGIRAAGARWRPGGRLWARVFEVEGHLAAESRVARPPLMLHGCGHKQTQESQPSSA